MVLNILYVLTPVKGQHFRKEGEKKVYYALQAGARTHFYQYFELVAKLVSYSHSNLLIVFQVDAGRFFQLFRDLSQDVMVQPSFAIFDCQSRGKTPLR